MFCEDTFCWSKKHKHVHVYHTKAVYKLEIHIYVTDDIQAKIRICKTFGVILYYSVQSVLALSAFCTS